MLKQKASLRLFICLFIIYAMNTFTKIAFSAVTAALIDEAILTKTQAGTISGVFWFVYAIGQFAGGALANKYPAMLIKISLIGGAVTNILMAFAGGYIPMLAIWTANGILQCGLWPSILSLLANKIIPEQRTKALTNIAYCYGIGSILSYLCTSAVLSTLSWQYLFICCGVASLLSLTPVFYMEKELLPNLSHSVKEEVKNEEKIRLPKGFIIKSGLIFFCLMFFIKSLCESGIKTWMPTILLETYGAPPEFTSLLSVVLLLLNLCGVSVCALIYRKTKQSEPISLFTAYILILPLTLLLLNFRALNMYVTTVIFSVITVLLYGSGQILSINYPSRFQRFGGTAFIGGVMNCFAAMGNVFAAFLSGLLADLFGWDSIIYMWNISIALFLLFAIASLPVLKKFIKENK